MNREKILIIDDEPINITILAQLLSEDYEILVATNGGEGLKIAKEQLPSIVLLDIVMPEMDGYEVAKELQNNSQTQAIPFIFLTAKSDTQSIVDGFNRGAVDYISKPFVKEELLARIKTHLQVHSLNTSLMESIALLEKKNKEVEKSKKEFEMIFNQSYDGIALTDLETNFILVNDAYTRITGYTKEELYTKSCHELSINNSFNTVVDALNDGHVENIEIKLQAKDKTIHVNISASLMTDKKTVLLNTKDITSMKLAEKKLEHFAEIMDEHVLSSSTDLEGNIIAASQAYCRISGFEQEELLGKKHNITRDTDIDSEIYDDLWNTITQNKTWRGELRNRKKDGGYYWIEATIIPDFDDVNKIGYTAIRQNITSKKKIEEISIQDELTQLFNRRYFNKIFEQECNRAKRSRGSFLLMMLDVDNFKIYNDTYGHQEGDNALMKIGEVLNAFSKRSGDYAFRLGGEEFGVIAQQDSKEEAFIFAEQIREEIEALNIVHEFNTPACVVTVSIGLFYKTLTLQDTQKEIYKACDDLLYKAKESGRNRVVSN